MPNSHSPRRQRNWEPLFAHHTKKGPRRYHRDGTPGKERLPLNAEERNPWGWFGCEPNELRERKGYWPASATIGADGLARYTWQNPVRMKLPRLRRVKRAR